ncbi:unnamed protein product [Rangifer tarandus platyrhynchus]|uniref:Uncharacterized protein n=1 Tax=Rangifer tarandus platyrhynchus TaxID=3082113 RepID=A0AC60A726_RANTA
MCKGRGSRMGWAPGESRAVSLGTHLGRQGRGELWGPTAEDGKKVGLGLQLMGLDTESVKLQLAPLGALNVDGLLASWNVGCSARGALRQGGSLQLGGP